ncbi:MAG: hypothetical protein HGB21_01120 [Nitrospirae bacterium]|nr:hypothetical protein [Nitrospirota bacterium]NTW64902.1 hypothetical protein [Nitrospirota bacterium]
MQDKISSGRGRVVPVILPFCFVVLIALPSLLLASESCSMLSGKCRDACGANEKAEAGDFEDCGAKQECCVAHTEAPVQCCITSFDARDFGPSNCRAPEGGVCKKSSGSPAPCAKLPMCATTK